MTTLPGTITSPTAGPLLRRGAPVVFVPGCSSMLVLGVRDDRVCLSSALVDWTELTNGEDRICSTAEVSLDLTDPAGTDLAARWLSRHLGNWQSWEVSRAMQGDYATLAAIYRQLGLPDPGRWEPHPDPAEALRLACLAAAGVTP